MKATPQRERARDRYQVPAVDGYAMTPCRGRHPRPLLIPAPEPGMPEGEDLHRRRLARVVRTNEDHGIAQLDIDFVEPLEVANA